MRKMYNMHNRRHILTWFAASAAAGVLAACGSGRAEARSFPLNLGDAEWRKRLSAAQYRILRQEGTERPYTSALLKEKRKGTFVCAGCKHRLYASNTKYDSRTGWPSFWQALPGAVGTSRDFKIGYPRTEVHCANCGGHLGHIFNDGPKPTGKRHCINGLALNFVPAVA